MRIAIALALMMFQNCATCAYAQSDAPPPPRLIRRNPLATPPSSGPIKRLPAQRSENLPVVDLIQFSEPALLPPVSAPVSLSEFMDGQDLQDSPTKVPSTRKPANFPEETATPAPWRQPVVKPTPQGSTTIEPQLEVNSATNPKVYWSPVNQSRSKQIFTTEGFSQPEIKTARVIAPPPPNEEESKQNSDRYNPLPTDALPIYDSQTKGAWQANDSVTEESLMYYNDSYYALPNGADSCFGTPDDCSGGSDPMLFPDHCSECCFEDEELSPVLILGVKGGNDRSLIEVQSILPLWQDELSFLFGDIQGRFSDDEASEGHFGLGYRTLVHPEWIFGTYGYYDLRKTTSRNRFNQLTAGVELLSPDWDVRLNGYFPNENSKNSNRLSGVSNGTIVTNAFAERAYPGFDFEVGKRILHWGRFDSNEIRWFVGYNHFDSSAQGFRSISGPKTRVEFRSYDLPFLGHQSRLTAGLEYSTDKVRDDQYWGYLRVQIPLTPGWSRGQLNPIRRRFLDAPSRLAD